MQFVSDERNESVILLNSSVMSLSQVKKESGISFHSPLKTSDPKRWVNLWTVQVLYSRSIVWMSSRLESSLEASPEALASVFLRNVLQNELDPIGHPRTRRPSTTSQG